MLEAHIPAGRHVIELSYWPAAFTDGLAVAGAVAYGFVLTSLIVGLRAAAPPTSEGRRDRAASAAAETGLRHRRLVRLPHPAGRGIRGLEGAYPTIVVDNSSSRRRQGGGRGVRRGYVDPGAQPGIRPSGEPGTGAAEPADDDVLLLNPDASISPPAIEACAPSCAPSPGRMCGTGAADPGVSTS